MTPPRDDDEWLQIQYQMAHHDIWWVKAQQMHAGYWTLLLLGAFVGAGALVNADRSCSTAPWEGWVLDGLATLVTALGVLYVWNLHRALVRSRDRAAVIVQPLQHSVFDDVKVLGRRSLPFPIAVTLILVFALVLVWW